MFPESFVKYIGDLILTSHLKMYKSELDSSIWKQQQNNTRDLSLSTQLRSSRAYDTLHSSHNLHISVNVCVSQCFHVCLTAIGRQMKCVPANEQYKKKDLFLIRIIDKTDS